MLWTIAVLLMLLWAVGMVSAYTIGGFIHILLLLAITLAVQGAFAGFFLYLRQRAKRIADDDLELEWSELQGGASRT